MIEFMDVILEPEMNIYVNNKVADRDTKVYENFSVLWTMEELNLSEVIEEMKEAAENGELYENPFYEEDTAYEEEKTYEEQEKESDSLEAEAADPGQDGVKEQEEISEDPAETTDGVEITVIVNKSPITLKGKQSYVFVDIFDYIDIDLSKPQGSTIVTEINGRTAQYMEAIYAGDVIEVYWRK